MADARETDKAPQPDRTPTAEAAKAKDSGKQAQLDEARDEGAGKAAVPIDQTSTANDK